MRKAAAAEAEEADKVNDAVVDEDHSKQGARSKEGPDDSSH